MNAENGNFCTLTCAKKLNLSSKTGLINSLTPFVDLPDGVYRVSDIELLYIFYILVGFYGNVILQHWTQLGAECLYLYSLMDIQNF